MDELALVARARRFAERPAISCRDGTFTYQDLLSASASAAAGLLDGSHDLGEARIAFLVPPGFTYPAVQWGIWRAGGIAVPLATMHPPAELEYVIDDAGAAAVVTHPQFGQVLGPICAARGLRLLSTDELLSGERSGSLPEVAEGRRAMILYTSGTTSRPKGVVWTHRNVRTQVEILVEAWAWSRDDRVLHVLPLHHVHGIINVLTCALWSGATCEVLPGFDAVSVWDGLGAVTVFMAVPTIYYKLIAAWEAMPPARREQASRAAAGLRLMVSGSAALPVGTLKRWREITGHTLLERYGMTEIGMALSNPLAGDRVAGTVGTPLTGVEVRLVDEEGMEVGPGEPGEVEVRGASVFLEYWGRPQATTAAFRDGWFRTGDLAVIEGGRYRILGRMSVDIIKSGGYKVSALEVEEVLRTHPQVADCAVVGLPDPEWGERVAVALVPRGGAAPDLEALRDWGGDRLAPYKLPTRLMVLEELPRNALGKVTKPAVVEQFG